MPELPDLEVFAANLNKTVSGKVVADLKLSKKLSINVSSLSLRKAIRNEKLKNVFREGKELRFEFSNGKVLGLHLMLHGKMIWENLKKDEVKNPLAQFYFSNGYILSITDFMRAAKLTLNPQKNEIPDALSATVNTSWWKKTLASSRSQIKSVLMNQQIIRGIGNAYADEILWTAGISPFSNSASIPSEKIKELASAVKKVMRSAISSIKKTAPGIIGGEVRDFLSIHNARKKTDPKGQKIYQSTLGGRKTYYVKNQILYK